MTIKVPQSPDVVSTGGRRFSSSRSTKPQLIILSRLRFIQQLLISLQALRRGSSDNRCNCAPLRGHQLCQMKQLLVLLLGPLDLANARV